MTTYLNVPFKDKAEARGARWDHETRKWFVPIGRDLEPFTGWLPVDPAKLIRTDAAVLAAPSQGVPLSRLLVGVAVEQAFRQGVWTTAEVVRADGDPHVYLELAERDAAGSLVAKARAHRLGPRRRPGPRHLRSRHRRVPAVPRRIDRGLGATEKGHAMSDGKTFKQAYATLQKHAQGLRSQQEPDIDNLTTIVSESVAAYKVCKERIDAVEKALEQALGNAQIEGKSSEPTQGSVPSPSSSRAPARRGFDSMDADDDTPF